MSIVVSDTSPLHYLVLCGGEGILPRLFDQVIVPPAVFAELQHANTPIAVQQWMRLPPAWLVMRKPAAVDASLNVDAGEREAICLAREIHAAAVLIDDRVGRAVAVQCGLAVIGTLGLLEEAAAQGWVDLPQVIERLRSTNARLDPKLIETVLARHRARATP